MKGEETSLQGHPETEMARGDGDSSAAVALDGVCRSAGSPERNCTSCSQRASDDKLSSMINALNYFDRQLHSQ